MSGVQLDSVSLRRGESLVLDGVTFAAPAGALTVIVGASGAGKTTVLRAVAGLDPIADGTVRIGGADMRSVKPDERGVTMVFQEPSLFPTRNVKRNIAFPLEVRRATAQEIADRVGAQARVLHIHELLRREVDQLSVGEAQMVQVARALVRVPAVVLLDEPFSSVEDERAGVLRRELRLVQQAFGVTTLLATNDPRDALSGADLVVVMEDGRAVQVGRPSDVYEHPDTATSAMLLGDADLLRVTVDLDRDGAWLVHDGFRLRAWQPALRRHGGRRMQMVTRPEWWELDPHGTVGGVVRRIGRSVGASVVVCDVGGQLVVVALPPGERPPEDLEVGSPVGLRLRHWVLLDPLDGRRIELTA